MKREEFCCHHGAKLDFNHHLKWLPDKVQTFFYFNLTRHLLITKVLNCCIFQHSRGNQQCELFGALTVVHVHECDDLLWPHIFTDILLLLLPAVHHHSAHALALIYLYLLRVTFPHNEMTQYKSVKMFFDWSFPANIFILTVNSYWCDGLRILVTYGNM